jgi:hypothetical protein
LRTFPNLIKVSVTSSTEAYVSQEQGRLETPFHRVIGFYPKCLVWYGLDFRSPQDMNGATKKQWASVRHNWRGHIIDVEEFLSAIEKKETNALEFTVLTNTYPTGIGNTLFHSVSEDYIATKNLSTHLTLLEFALNVREAECTQWQFYRSGLLKEAFAGVKHLRTFLFRTNAETDLWIGDLYRERDHVPLADIIPVSS